MTLVTNAAGQIQLVGGTNPLENQNDANVLASLSSIGQNAVLTVVGGSLAVDTNLVNQGFLGVGLNKFGGTMTVGGSFTQTSTGTFRVHFGSELSIGATATLGGSLDTQVNGNCRPQDGAIATAMTFAARNGMFTTHNSGFNVLYGPTSVGCPELSGRGSNRIFTGKDRIKWQGRNAVTSLRNSRRKPPGWW